MHSLPQRIIRVSANVYALRGCDHLWHVLRQIGLPCGKAAGREDVNMADSATIALLGIPVTRHVPDLGG